MHDWPAESKVLTSQRAVSMCRRKRVPPKVGGGLANSLRVRVIFGVRSWREEEEEVFITSGNWRGKHNSLSRGAGADQP